MYDVITCGSCTVDVFAYAESELIKIKSVRETEELIAYPSGSKILIRKLKFETGGGGTNTAVAMARFGLKVAYLGQIGDDENAEKIIHMLQHEKIDFVGKQVKGVSGYSVILNSLENDRSILAYKGVNNDLVITDKDLEGLKPKWFYFSTMMRKSFHSQEKIARYAKDNGIKLAFNPSNYLAEKGSAYSMEIIKRTDLLVLNKDELELLVGRHPMSDMILKLMEFGPPSVVVTDGKRGAYTIKDGYLYKVNASGITPRETTGAGDSFAATFLACMLRYDDVGKALKMAQVNAESVIMYTGAKNVLLHEDEILKGIKDITVEKTKLS